MFYSLSEHPLVFKGGSYLWLFHGLNRFSEDLDFTALEPVKSGIASNIRDTLELFGVANHVDVIKDDKYTLTLRIAAQGPLYTSPKDLCFVYVEISRREKVLEEPITVKLEEYRYGVPLTFLYGMSLAEEIGEKIRALYSRKFARDLYDLHFLLCSLRISVNIDLINRKLSFYGLKFRVDEFLKHLKGVEEYWEKELKPIVLGPLPSFNEVFKGVEDVLRKS
ncbi:MAG: nucleotidyl transferase AbiEii/AbiGii toxin family protein [Candidatus Verstraetearchaeota archaeon]|nr:nucleotidyl transferase AbiEii/AbiGii toxin family protein [Candidatus Verstraetearchaeota archaeon]